MKFRLREAPSEGKHVPLHFLFLREYRGDWDMRVKRVVLVACSKYLLLLS